MELVEVCLVEVSEGKADMADVAAAVVVGWSSRSLYLQPGRLREMTGYGCPTKLTKFIHE